MKIEIFCNGGYKGFTTNHFPIVVEAVETERNGGYHVKVSDLEALGVYDSAIGQQPTEENGGGIDYNPETGVLFFMHHEVEIAKFGKVKVRILESGDYFFKPEHNRTFPVIVNGYRHEYQLHTVSIMEADARAIGMYVNGFKPSFCLDGHKYYGAEAEIIR